MVLTDLPPNWEVVPDDTILRVAIIAGLVTGLALGIIIWLLDLLRNKYSDWKEEHELDPVADATEDPVAPPKRFTPVAPDRTRLAKEIAKHVEDTEARIYSNS